MAIATDIAERITAMRYADLPAEAVHWAKVAIIDTLACALAGTHEQAPRIAEKVAATYGGGGPTLLWGSNRRASALDAAVINGTASHALDYDDVNNTTGGHCPTFATSPVSWQRLLPAPQPNALRLELHKPGCA